MRVRYLSGNYAGQAVDLPRVEAETSIATGFAEAAPEPELAPPVASATAAEDETPAAERPKVRRGRS